MALLMASSPMYSEFKAQKIDNAPFMSVSANGKYGVFTLQGIALGVVNLENPQEGDLFFDDRDNSYYQNEYLPGYGTALANDGTCVGNAVLYEFPTDSTYVQTDNAVIYKNGKVIPLPAPNPKLGNMAHSITPDGSVICGNIGNDNFSINAKKIMLLPVVWYRNADGSYADPVVLPHPEKDFLGGVPQYVTAVAMSADGNTIAGTVTATSGFWVYPIVYKRDASGEWSYSLPALNLFHTHPEVQVPANPGDYPDLEDFATDEEKAAYQAALEAWQAAGGQDWANYPRLENFMTADEIAAYKAAVAKYNVDKAAYDAAVDAATAGSITLTFNNVILSPDGKTVSSTYLVDSGFGPMLAKPKYNRMIEKAKRHEEGEGEEEEPTSTIYSISTEDGSYKTYTCKEGLSVTCAANRGILMAYSGTLYDPKAYVVDPEKGAIELQDYYKETCPEMSAWIPANMKHEVEDYDYETGEVIWVEKLLSGQPFCTPDMKTIVSMIVNTFDLETEALYFGYVFQGLPEVSPSGVKDVKALENGLGVERGGIVTVSGEAFVEVFATDGSKVFAGQANGRTDTGLGNGVYVVRATFADGKTAVRKALF